ncbi:MAG: hypothetical protein MNPFHGCM_01568 [Gemmatimonadaceae bacterium]|nr:hypothetical protein [Gemmatimonadaceae bacterium]
MSGGISDSAFVAAMAGLRRLPVHSMIDSASRMAARDSILRANGLTAAQLEAAAAALASDPGRAAAIWDAVTRKENSPRDTGPTVQGADSSK